MDDVSVFDSDGMVSYFKEPYPSGLFQAGYTSYRAYWDKSCIRQQSEDSFYSGLSPSLVSGSSALINPKRISVCKDGSGAFWAVAESTLDSKVIDFTSGAATLRGTIPAFNVKIFNNYTEESGIKVFYTKNDGVYFREEKDGFTQERNLLYRNNLTLRNAAALGENLLKLEIHAIDNRGHTYILRTDASAFSCDYAFLNFNISPNHEIESLGTLSPNHSILSQNHYNFNYYDPSDIESSADFYQNIPKYTFLSFQDTPIESLSIF